MKKLYFTIVLAIIANTVFAQNFTAGNLVLLRHNMEGTTSGGTTTSGKSTNGTKAIQIFLDEYKLSTDGNSLELVQSVPLPAAANGANNPVTTFGADDLEGYMTRSYDGRYLIVPGYGVATGTELSSTFSAGTAAGRTPRADVQKSIAVIDYQKNINSETLLPTSVFKEKSVIGAASYDGTDLWLSGGWGVDLIDGPYYTTKGSTSAVSLLTTTNRLYGTKDIRIFNNQLYAIHGFGNAGTSNSYYFYKIGDGLPKTSTTTTQQTSFLSSNNMAGLYIANLPNGKVVAYVANAHSSSQTIRKYSQKADGSWVNNFASTTPWGKDGVSTPKAIDGKVDPVTGKVTLYIVSSSRNASGGDSKVYMLEDENGHSETAGAATISGTPKLLLNITGENQQFRSIAWAPVQESVLPIKLSSFGAKYLNNSVQLNWTTATETNNSHFEVLRSNGNGFKAIGTVKGNGNSNQEKSYNFTDYSPLSSISYYQLRQVDIDGKSELSKIIPVKIALITNGLSVTVSADGQVVKLSLNTDKVGLANITINNINGQKIANSTQQVEKGLNIFSISAPLKKGIYIVSLTLNSTKQISKLAVE